MTEVVEPSSADVRMVRGPAYLEFRLPVPADPTPVAIEARFALTAFRQTFSATHKVPQPLDLAGPERELYTRPKEGLIQVTPAILGLADTLAGGCDDPWESVDAFWSFVFDRMKSGFIHHGELDPADPLGSLVRRGWFDCTTGAALLVGLCRARGIAARIIHGIKLTDPFLFFHYWAEFFSPSHGWVPLDLMSWELAAGRLDLEPWGRLFLGRMDYRLKCQCFPHRITGPVGVRFPSLWCQLVIQDEEGTETSYHALEPSRLLFRDLLRVTCPDAPPDERA